MLRPRATTQEYEVLRLQGLMRSNAADEARTQILHWATRRAGTNFPSEAWSFNGFDHFLGGRNCSAIRLQSFEADIWALRSEDPDKSAAGRTWTTEIVVASLKGEPLRLTVRLIVNTSEKFLNVEPHSPGFLQQISDRVGLWIGPYKTTTRPVIVDDKDAYQSLADMLVDPARRVPVFIASVPETATAEFRTLIDAESLTRATLGMGHVYILGRQASRYLTSDFGSQNAVFGGSVRAYLPGFSADADPYMHRLVFADQINDYIGQSNCQRWMRSLAAQHSLKQLRLSNDILAFSAIREAYLEERQNMLHDGGASAIEQLAAAEARIKALKDQLDNEIATQEYFSQEHRLAEERAEVAENQARMSAFRIQCLISERRNRSAENEISDVQAPSSWGKTFTDWCDNALAGSIVLTPSAQRGLRSPEFEDLGVVVRCLQWLADKGVRYFTEGGKTKFNNLTVESGIQNSHCGNDCFDISWQGQQYTVDWHIKNGGNTRDPARCLRIYYFWDSTSKQIVIAHLPAHRRSDAS